MKAIEKIVGVLAIIILVPCAVLVIIIVGSSIFGKTFKNVSTEEPASEVVQTAGQEETAVPAETTAAEASTAESMSVTTAPITETTQPADIGNDTPDHAPLFETGTGTFTIKTQDGTSENGSIPIVNIENGATLVQIEIETKNFNADQLSYIYVDEFFVKKEQLSDSQSIIDLIDHSLTPGTHKVEIYQYENDNENAAVVTYKTASYEIKLPL